MHKSYSDLQRQLATGWNTWDTRSVTSHVLMPYGLAVMLGFREYKRGRCLKTPLIGRQAGSKGAGPSRDLESIVPGWHAYDGSYTQLTLSWQDLEVSVETCHSRDDPNILLITITPIKDNDYRPSALIIDYALLWQQPGYTTLDEHGLIAHLPSSTMRVFHDHETLKEMWTESTCPHQVISLKEPLFLSIGQPLKQHEIQSQIAWQRDKYRQNIIHYKQSASLYDGLQSALAWNTIYEPHKNRVCTTVSRIWNCNAGGYSLFCWDTYFAAFMASIDNEALACANFVEITREATDQGFVPNCAHRSFSSLDRSQPCVGSLILLHIYRRYHNKSLCAEVFDQLLLWNRWWTQARDHRGYLCWGSNRYEPQAGNIWESQGVGDRFGAALESGLDNSPLYDDIPFNDTRQQLELADVGLMGLYVSDCQALAEIASVLGRHDEQRELIHRALSYQKKLQTLWHEKSQIFLNRHIETGQWSQKIAPTLLYPMLSGTATEEQVHQMIDEHLVNPNKLGGEWLLPSISRDDPAFAEQDYWRGRIWAPMNFLVYLGLRNYDTEKVQKARQAIADNAEKIFRIEWDEKRHIHENYCALTGKGSNVVNSDRFYHWGALLAAIQLMERGYFTNDQPAEIKQKNE